MKRGIFVALTFLLHLKCFAQGNLLLGFILGSMMASHPTPNAGSQLSAVGQIPLRCLAASSEDEYLICRLPSMRAELQAPRSAFLNGGTSICDIVWTGFRGNSAQQDEGRRFTASCDETAAIRLELKALHVLNAQLDPNHQTK